MVGGFLLCATLRPCPPLLLPVRLPSPYGVTLNLVKLYRAVCIRGGYAQCTECKQWRRVAHEFELPVTATAASHQFRNFYVKFCLDYENRCV